VKSSSSRRIAVTGLGATCALGGDMATTWDACRNGVGGLGMELLSSGDYGPPAREWLVGKIKGNAFAALEASLGRRIGASLDPVAVYSLQAAHEALTSAGLIGQGAILARGAVVFGHGMGGVATMDVGYERVYGMKLAKVHPLTVPKIMVSAPPSAIAIEFGFKGPVFAVSSACSSSGHAIAQGAMMIQSGRADMALVGGGEAVVTASSMLCWEGLQATSKTACRPFSLGRDGMVIGEGAAALVLEDLDHARARGAPILAELTGYGMTSDASHWTQPSLEGAMSSMAQACGAAGVLDSDNLLIAAHGTGTPLNDKNEAEAIRTLFGAHASSHKITATKSAHGHLIGATTALQAAIGLLALRDGMAPPILNFLEPDPDCDLNLVLGEAQPIDCRSLLVNSFAFGGLNTSLVFSKL
jgi:nodulation protein E